MYVYAHTGRFHLLAFVYYHLLTRCDCSQEFKKFWPQKDDAAEDFGHFHVSFQNYVEDGLYSSTDFLLQSTQVAAHLYKLLFTFSKQKTVYICCCQFSKHCPNRYF